MLGKLFKYDVKYINKHIMPLCIISIILTIFTRGLYELSSYSLVFKILGIMSAIVANTLLANVIIHTIIRTISRFKNSLYGDESYLIHTLPVKRRDIFLSKVLMGTLYMLISVAVVLLCLVIEYYTKDRFESLKQIFNVATLQYNMSISKIIIMFSLYIFFAFEWIQLMVFSAIELGYRKNDKKRVMSLIYAAIFYFATQAVNLIILLITAAFSSEIKDAIITNNMGINALNNLFYIILILNFVYIIIYYFIGQKLLSKNVNVE